MLSMKLAKKESTIYTTIYVIVEQEVGLSSAPKSTPPVGFGSVCKYSPFLHQTRLPECVPTEELEPLVPAAPVGKEGVMLPDSSLPLTTHQ